MDFLVLPPEVNSLRVHAGAGPDSMLAAVSAWDRLADELRSAATSFGSLAAGLSGASWRGPASAAMTEVAAAYLGWLAGAAGQAEHAATQARLAAQAFEAAFAATVHPGAVAANRARLVSLVRSNLFGQNASVIAAAEADYEQMWAQDVAAMLGYHASASVAGGELMPWQQLAQSLAGQIESTPSQTRLTVPGAAPGLLTGNSSAQKYAALNKAIGGNWFPGTVADVVSYPATAGVISSLTAPTANQSFAIGQQALHADILNAVSTGHPVVVAGLSEGTIVIDRELAYLAGLPNAPSPNLVTFVEFANPERGLAATYLPAGFTIPGAGYTAANSPVSQYNTAVVFSQYDGWADPPDRPWNLLATFNAYMGATQVHTNTLYASPSQTVQLSSVTNSLGGTTTTYMIPTTTLPLLAPLERMGVPAPLISELNNLLTPVVHQGYSQYSSNANPYLSHGKLVW
jgi:PPE-repeat protein